jgi:hypothetical protein
MSEFFCLRINLQFRPLLYYHTATQRMTTDDYVIVRVRIIRVQQIYHFLLDR